MLEYEFMINAFIASGIVAVLSGIVGYFLVLRSQTFAGHALAHVGFTGATGAVLLGFHPLSGMIIFTLVVGIGMGAFGERITRKDVSIGVLLSLALGIGLLFSHFFSRSTNQITTLLFGNVLGVDQRTLIELGVLAIISFTSLAIIGRRLVFTSLQPELAEARGVSMRTTSMLFLALVAISVATSAQIVGALLVFTLMVAPAAVAQNLSIRLANGIVLTVIISLIEAWGGITCAYYTDWPTSFWISTIGSLAYMVSTIYKKLCHQ